MMEKNVESHLCRREGRVREYLVLGPRMAEVIVYEEKSNVLANCEIQNCSMLLSITCSLLRLQTSTQFANRSQIIHNHARHLYRNSLSQQVVTNVIHWTHHSALLRDDSQHHLRC